GNRIPTGAPDPTTRITLETTANQVERFDCFGNALKAAVADGKIELDVGTYPSYLVLPAGAEVKAVPEDWGTNVAQASLGAIAEAGSEQGTSPAVSAIDGNNSSGSS